MAKFPPADLDTLQKVRVVLAAAQRRHEDAAEALDRAGLLWSPGRSTHDSLQSLAGAASLLEEMQVVQVARAVGMRLPTSMSDMKALAVAFIRSLIKDTQA